MVKAPSSHGLDRKFKSWRRGKSEKSNRSGKSSTSSVKSQLRGLERLYKKKSLAPDKDDAQLAEMQLKIDALKMQMDTRNLSEKEKANSTKSHKMRFIERQRTTRVFKELTKRLSTNLSSKERKEAESELYKLALDQVYIAHYPLDLSSYLSLYVNGNVRRKSMNNRLLFKMAAQRKVVLERLHKRGSSSIALDDDAEEMAATSGVAKKIQRASWVHPSQYERVQNTITWSTDQERTVFEISTVDGKAETSVTITDDRFKASGNTASAMLLEEHEKVEQEMDEELAQVATASKQRLAPAKALNSHGTDSSNSESDDDDYADPLTESIKAPAKDRPLEKPAAAIPKNQSLEKPSASNGSSRSDDDDSNDEVAAASIPSHRKSSTRDSAAASSSSSSSSSSDDEDSRKERDEPTSVLPLSQDKSIASFLNNTGAHKLAPEQEDVDDFLVAAPAENTDVFANAKRSAPSMDKGDKSKGWATQRQLPGQFRKKQRR